MRVTYADVAVYHPFRLEGVYEALDVYRQQVFSYPVRSLAGLENRNFPIPKQMGFDDDVRLNELVWPVGASRWGYFLATITSKELEVIYERAANTAGLPLQSAPLVFTKSDGTTLTVEMFPLTAIPISKYVPNRTDNDVYLLPLVDHRYFWWFASTALTYSAGSTTWSSLITEILTALGYSTYTIDAIASEYLKPGRLFDSKYEPLPVILDGACSMVGKRLLYNYDNTISIVGPDTAIAALSSRFDVFGLSKQAGGVFETLNNAREFNTAVPKSVTVVFPKETDGERDGQHVETVTLQEVDFTQRPAGSVGFDGTHVIWNSAVAQYTGPTFDNEAEIQALAKQIAEDYYKWRSFGATFSLSGTHEWPPTGYEHSVHIRTTDTLIKMRPFDDSSTTVSTYGTGGEGNVDPTAPELEVRELTGPVSVKPVSIISFDNTDGFSLVDAGGGEVEVHVSIPSSFNLIVEEDDATPSYTNIDQIQFDADWFVVTQPAANNAHITWRGVTTRLNSGTPTYGPQTRLNFIEGSNMTITMVEDAANNEIDITFASTASGSSLVVRDDELNVSVSNVDLIEVNYDDGFRVVDNTGGDAEIQLEDGYFHGVGGTNTTLGAALSPTVLNLSYENADSNNYGHGGGGDYSLASNVVTVNEPGLYFWAASASFQNASLSTDTGVQFRVEADIGLGYNTLAGGNGYCECSLDVGYGNCSMQGIVTLNATNTIRLVGIKLNGADTIRSMAETVNLVLYKLRT